MGCPFGFPSDRTSHDHSDVIPAKKNNHTPLELLKHCFTLSGDFSDVCAFFLLLCSAFWVGNNRESNNGILEATSFRGGSN